MKKVLTLLITLACFCPLQGWAGHSRNAVQIDIIADDGTVFPYYVLDETKRKNTLRAWLEAKNGENYSIRVRNLRNQRIGMVIAVDGRNIISGSQSRLKPDERMYILGPYEMATYAGWRTSNSRINRFYFTDAGDSYAGAFADFSAMGVIALVVFPEKEHFIPYSERLTRQKQNHPNLPAEAQAAAGRAEADVASAEREAGTGFGEEQYSRSRLVEFDPVQIASQQYYFKYEWHETLCNRGVLDCSSRRPNRFWPGDGGLSGYAPYPPR